MVKALILLLGATLLICSCSTQRTICPAYQSAFLFDKNTSKDPFVYYNLNKDQPREVLASNGKAFNLPPRDSAWERSVVLPGPSLPIERRVKKDRYLLLPKKTYKKALRDLQTIQMKPVYPKKVEEDTAAIRKLLDSAARSITDTITAAGIASKPEQKQAEDSVYVISLEKEKFNVDQDNYMWYFRDILVLPDVKAAMEESKTEAKEAKGKKKGFFASLKGLFKKKPKKDSLATTEPVQTDSAGNVIPPKKKGFSFKGLFGKKSKKEAPVKKEEEAIKEEEEKF